MEDEKKNLKRLPWHAGFYASIQIELEEDAENLIFENEHQLSKKPLAMDVLIIKKLQEQEIKKKIGKIFKGHNIIEYKSPDDGLSIDDFYKVIAYAGLYKSDVQCVDSIKAEDITITFVSKGYPRKMILHIQKVQGLEVTEVAQGRHYITGGMFPMQLLVTSKLSEEENFWLRNLRNDIKLKEEAESILKEYEKHNHSNLHKSVMDLIVRANEQKFEEARGSMCDALMELMQDVIQEKVEDGKKLGILEGAQEKLFEQVQKKLAKGKNVEQIADELEESVDVIKKLIQQLEEKKK